MRFAKVAAATAAMAAAPAGAAWHEATTRHFVVYADDRPDAVQKMANDLERFDALVRFFQVRDEIEGAEANKLAIYVLPSVGALQDVCGAGCANVGGFYLGRASGSVAFTPRRSGSGGATEMSARIVLFHEYGHHFLLGNFARAFPAWFSEGYAEFVSTARLGEKDATLGAPANHRAFELLAMAPLPIERLLDPPERRSAIEVSQFYARGWLLTHYLMMQPGGLEKLNAYLKAFSDGVPSVEAARRTFGDLKALDRTLDAYVRRRSFQVMTLPNARLVASPATVRAMTPGEAALIRMRMESTRGVDDKSAPKLLARAKPVAARFPDDAAAQGWYAEMALDAGDLDGAEQAADRALAVDPRSAQALLYKSYVLQRRALDAKKTDSATWSAARRPLLAANRLSNDNAAVLQAFYSSFMAQGAQPSPGARAGLQRAQALVPQDEGLRFMAARQQLVDGDGEAAKRLLRPLAYSPHGGGGAAVAQAMLKKLEAGGSTKGVLDELEAAKDEAEKPKDAGDAKEGGK